MKKLIVGLLFIGMLAGCGDGMNKVKCMDAVKAGFKNSDVRPVGDGGFRFIVKDETGGIWYVETLGIGVDISYKTKIF